MLFIIAFNKSAIIAFKKNHQFIVLKTELMVLCFYLDFKYINIIKTYYSVSDII